MWLWVSEKGKESKLQALLSAVASKNTAVADCRVQPKTSFTIPQLGQVNIAASIKFICGKYGTSGYCLPCRTCSSYDCILVLLSKLILTMDSRPHIRRKISLFWHILGSRQVLQVWTWSLEKNDKFIILILKFLSWNVLAETYPVILSRWWKSLGIGQAWPRRPWLGPTRPNSSWKKTVIIFEHDFVLFPNQ